MFKKLVLISSIALAFATGAQATTAVVINAQGAGSPAADANLTVGALGYNDGNAITVPTGSNTSILVPNGGGLVANQIVQTYGQGSLANFSRPNGNAIGGTNLNSTYEWTYVFGVQEAVTTGGFNASFNTVAGGNNFFRLYYDTSMDSNNLAGTGFANGTLILSGTILTPDGVGNGTSNFTVSSPSTRGALDQHGTNDYPNVTTVTGNGSSQFEVQVTSYNASFFQSLPQILSLTLGTFQNLPYTTTDPSAAFYNGTTSIPGVPNVGTTNGISGPDVMFQTRGSSSFVTAVPEPGSVALLGIGLALAGATLRRRRVK